MIFDYSNQYIVVHFTRFLGAINKIFITIKFNWLKNNSGIRHPMTLLFAPFRAPTLRLGFFEPQSCVLSGNQNTTS